MSNYYIEGYTVPDGVKGREGVKEYQRMLGVKADGIWGPVTQSAYERGYGADPYAANTDAFNKYYQTVYSALSTPSISVSTPSRAQLETDWAASLRPGVELAIDKRRKRGEQAMAELDADAASRGMGASTYVSSMKEREDDDVEEDVSAMEAQYTSTLAERIASAMQYYSSLELQAATANAQMASSAANTAMGIASSWYQSYLNGLNSGVQRSYGSGVRSAGAGTQAGAQEQAPQTEGSELSMADCLRYINMLGAQKRSGLFNSPDEYWAVRRNELIDAMGAGMYEKLRREYAAGGSGNGGGIWRASAK